MSFLEPRLECEDAGHEELELESDEHRNMLDASGHVTSGDYLVNVLYHLARDKMPVGEIESIVDNSIAPKKDTVLFTNGWLASWAKYTAERIRNGQA